MAKQKELKCNQCSQCFTARHNLHSHKKNYHGDGPMLSCSSCEKIFLRKEHLVSHKSSCNVCSKVFSRKSNLFRKKTLDSDADFERKLKLNYNTYEHFYLIQKLANKFDKFDRKVIRVFGVANHGKGEVDHVGGLAKVAIRMAVASGQTFHASSDMVAYLSSKYDHQTGPNYVYKEILLEDLEEAYVWSLP